MTDVQSQFQRSLILNKEDFKTRFQLLTQNSCKRLDDILSSVIHLTPDKATYPVLKPNLKKLLISIKHIMNNKLKDIRLVDSAASHVVDDLPCPKYDTIDILFNVSLNKDEFQKTVYEAVNEAFQNLEDTKFSATNIDLDAYILRALYIDNDPEDCWLKITLGNKDTPSSKVVNLLFLQQKQRQYEFTIDGFQINLNPCLTDRIDEEPVLTVESVGGSIDKTLYHLRNHWIYTRDPEQVHGGCLLKYCHLIICGFFFAPKFKIQHTERRMCTRYFIDFPSTWDQRNEIEYFLNCKIPRKYYGARAAFLSVLREIVSTSTICLPKQAFSRAMRLITNMRNTALMDLQMSRTYLQLDNLFSDNWRLDQVYYGTHHFPPILQASAFYYCQAMVANSNEQLRASPDESSTETTDNQVNDEVSNNENIDSIIASDKGDSSSDQSK